MDKFKSMNARRFRTEAMIETPVPVPYDANAVPGATVLGNDGQLYASTKSSSTSPYSWYRIGSLVGGRILLGLTSPRTDYNLVASTPSVVATPYFQIEGTEVEQPVFAIQAIGQLASRFLVCRSRGTQAARTALINGDQIGLFQFGGFDGSRTISGAQVTADIDGTVTTSDMPVQLRMRTRPAGLTGTYDRLTIASSGEVSIATLLRINNTTGTEKLSVTGNAQLTDTTNSFMVGTNPVVGSRKIGWTAPTGTATRTTFDTATVTTAQLAERVKALIDNLTTHGLIGA